MCFVPDSRQIQTEIKYGTIQYKFGEVFVLFCMIHTKITVIEVYLSKIYNNRKIQDPGINPPPNFTLYYSTKLVTYCFMMFEESFM